MTIQKKFRGSSRKKSAAALAFQRGSGNEDITVMEAAATGDHDSLRRLVYRGANIESANERGETALILAAMVGDAEAIQFLIDSGADVDAKSNYGLTSLMAAAQNGDIDAVKILIRKGADIAAAKPDGTDALMIAAMFGQTECVEELVAGGADVHAKDAYGYMPYMFAEGFPACQEILAVDAQEREKAEAALRPGTLKQALTSASRKEKRPRHKKVAGAAPPKATAVVQSEAK